MTAPSTKCLLTSRVTWSVLVWSSSGLNNQPARYISQKRANSSSNVMLLFCLIIHHCIQVLNGNILFRFTAHPKSSTCVTESDHDSQHVFLRTRDKERHHLTTKQLPPLMLYQLW
ncbi:Hypothetical_protein [Hexamita inflata]|uniref:Hypothetical_protein n=1 Tax=Hexamita inflata TaxID=28002 RepID=A0AA86S1F6_9EUKA|nr:Hypothetical protein HINF_LOCUS63985 [Hexamita inflata]